MDAVIKVSQAIAELTGPSCCKAYVRSALSDCGHDLRGTVRHRAALANTPIVCTDSDRHPHGCREEQCPYYRKPVADMFADPIHLPVMACRS